MKDDSNNEFSFGCDPDQYIPEELKHSHIYPDPRIKENKMKKKLLVKFWNWMWKIDTFNHHHFENSPILWTLFGDWFCNWLALNDPYYYQQDMEEYLDDYDEFGEL